MFSTIHKQGVKNTFKRQESKKIKRPLRTEQQKKLAQPKCRRILENFGDFNFVIDDKSFFTLSHTDQPGNDSYLQGRLKQDA